MYEKEKKKKKGKTVTFPINLIVYVYVNYNSLRFRVLVAQNKWFKDFTLGCYKLKWEFAPFFDIL